MMTLLQKTIIVVESLVKSAMTKRKRKRRRKKRRTSVLHVEICLGALLVEEGLHEALHYPLEEKVRTHQ